MLKQKFAEWREKYFPPQGSFCGGDLFVAGRWMVRFVNDTPRSGMAIDIIWEWQKARGLEGRSLIPEEVCKDAYGFWIATNPTRDEAIWAKVVNQKSKREDLRYIANLLASRKPWWKLWANLEDRRAADAIHYWLAKEALYPEEARKVEPQPKRKFPLPYDESKQYKGDLSKLGNVEKRILRMYGNLPTSTSKLGTGKVADEIMEAYKKRLLNPEDPYALGFTEPDRKENPPKT